MKIHFSAKQGALASHSRLGWVASSNLQLTEWPDCTFCPVVIQLSWPFNFLHASHVCHILASHHSQVSREIQLRVASWCIHLINSSHSLTHDSYFLHALHVCHILASHHSRVNWGNLVASCLLMHTLDQFFTLSRTQPLHYSHLNIGFLNAKLQVNMARNKANT